MLFDMALFLMQQARAARGHTSHHVIMHGDAGGTRPNSLRIHDLM